MALAAMVRVLQVLFVALAVFSKYLERMKKVERGPGRIPQVSWPAQADRLYRANLGGVW